MIIITNILAAITVAVVTNSTDEFTQEYFGGWYPEGPLPHQEQVKAVRTTVKKVRLLQFEFEGKAITEVLSEDILSDREVRYRSVPQEPLWHPMQTNDLFQWTLTATNWVGTNLVYSGDLTITNFVMFGGAGVTNADNRTNGLNPTLEDK